MAHLRRLLARSRLVLAVTAAFALSGAAPIARAQSVPTGFSVSLEIGEPFTGAPVAFTRLPDGRVLLVERSVGIVRLAAVGSSTSTVIHTVPNVEGIHPERGLLGIAVDPDWPSRPYVYVIYNHTSGFEFITMLTASGQLTNPASTAITLGSPFHLLTDISDVNGIHNGGGLHFGPDGMLYASIGEDGLACQAQNLSSPLGSILRLDVSSMPGPGMGPPPKSQITPPDNPFPGPDDWARLRFAWGLRNPFRFTIDPTNGALSIGDVGSSFFEEINRIEIPNGAGANFGWPRIEGTMPIFCCEDCIPGSAFTNPVHVFPHLPGVTSIIGGPVVRTNPGNPRSFPPEYEGDLFYCEFFSGVIRRLEPGAGGTWSIAPPVAGQPEPSNWGTGMLGITDMQMSSDGALELLAFGVEGTPRGLYRIERIPAIGAPEVSSGSEADLRSPAILARPNPAAAGVDVVLTIPRDARRRETWNDARVTIEDVRGRRVRELRAAAGAAGGGESGDTQVVWNQRDDAGVSVAPGIYFVRAWGAGSSVVPGRVTILR